MPSRVWEAFPLVVLEAFAAGRAVIGTRVPGIADLVEEGKTGLLFTDEHADELADILNQVAAAPANIREMGHSARDFANRYSWDSVAQMHVHLYRELVCP